MSHNLLLNASFHQRLCKIDLEMFKTTQEKGCPFCSGTLHRANYPRTGFGLPQTVRHYYEERFSLCCAQCRKRTTPPSVRFLGARRFVAFVLVLVCSQRVAPNEKRLARLVQRFNLRISLTTWQRWRKWWKEQFPSSSVWQELKGLFVHQDRINSFPRDVLRMLIKDRLVALLCFLSPLSVQVI